MKGLHRVNRRLADGTIRTYFYAWRGGPKMEAKPGTPEFATEFARLTADLPQHSAGTLTAILTEYQRSPAFTELASATQRGYIHKIKRIESKWGTLPIAAIGNPKLRGLLLDWRDQIAIQRGPREADYTLAVMARVLSWAYDRRKTAANPLERPGRLSKGSRAHIIWTDAEAEAFLRHAPVHVALPFQIALGTGQREGDILRLTWSAYDGSRLLVRQSKTGTHLAIPLTADLRATLDAAKARRGTALTICATSRGRPWTVDGFQTSFAKAKLAAGIEGRTFHDTRGTAVVRLARAGCSIPEIYAITGHDPKSAETILAKHYLGRDSELAESAIAKLDAHGSGTPTVKRAVKRPRKSGGEVP